MDEFDEIRPRRTPPPAAMPPPRPGSVPGQLPPNDPARYFSEDPTTESMSPAKARWIIAGCVAGLLLFFALLMPSRHSAEHSATSGRTPVPETPEQKAQRICRATWEATYRKPIADLTLEDTRLIESCEVLGYYGP